MYSVHTLRSKCRHCNNEHWIWHSSSEVPYTNYSTLLRNSRVRWLQTGLLLASRRREMRDARCEMMMMMRIMMLIATLMMLVPISTKLLN